MSTLPYSEFKWNAAGAADGESGVALAEMIIKRITALKKIERICDLGCGNGYISGRLATLGYDVVGIDASESGTRIARQTHPQARFICSFIDEGLCERIAHESFDLVISSDAIEHFYRPGDLVGAAVSLLKPDGQVLLGTPYHGYLKNLVLSLTGKMDAHFDVLSDGGHIKFFSVKTLSQLMAAHGFAERSFSFYGRAPWLWKNMICHARRSAK
jgi:2-polyprenyl-3-methyl-5-hydroxy-6-metoxy-1,4-benzoquinol methylase